MPAIITAAYDDARKGLIRSDDIFPTAHTKPWTSRVYNRLALNPFWVGIGLLFALLLAFLIGRYIVSGEFFSNSGDYRLVIIHILLAAYIPSAYAYLLSSNTRTTQDLVLVMGDSPTVRAAQTLAGKHLGWGIATAALIGTLVSVYATTITTVGSDPWNWQETGYDTRWMRILGPIFSAWISCFLYVLVTESSRLSRLTENIKSLDLFDLLPYRPLIRQGLINALITLCLVSILSLFLFEPGFVTLLLELWIIFAICAWLGLMLPLRGIRKKISQAKKSELAWCTQALQQSRLELRSGATGTQSMADITAYQDSIDSIRNWPFDNPTLMRFALYLLIPVVSVVGSVLVERALDVIL